MKAASRSSALGASSLVALACLCLVPAAARSQTPPSSSQTERVRLVHEAVEAVAGHLGDRLWPDFRPAERPVLYTGLGGGVLMDWSGELPPGFTEVEGLEGAAWSESPAFGALMARGTPFTSLGSSYTLPEATALAVHEHFHAHQRAAARQGAAFGRGERPADVRRYPALDSGNASLLELEGVLLHAALRADRDTASAERIREFLAVRDRRRSMLDSVSRAWERGTERNEGVADYVALRSLRWIAESDHGGWGDEAEDEIERRLSRLSRLSAVVESSLRRVFYVTGSAQGLLLDRLAPEWKERMVAGGGTLEDRLAAAVGRESGRAPDLYRRASRREDLAALRGRVGEALGALAIERRALADSVLAGDGIVVTLAADDAARVCGLDPLNVRHVGDGRVLHPGFVRVSAEEERYSASLTGDVVEDVEAGTFSVRAGPADGLELVADERELSVASLEAPANLRSLTLYGPGISLEASRARVRRTRDRLVVEPLP